MKPIGWIVAGFLALVLTGSVWDAIQSRGRAADAELRHQALVIINDSTQARYAKVKRERDEFKGLVDAGKVVGGKPVAGVEIVIKTDTIYVPKHTVKTDTLKGTRTALVADTTDEYTVHVDVTAPPYPSDLEVGYKIAVPDRTAEIGFVKADGGHYAVVSGKGITPTKAFFEPETVFPLSLVAGLGLKTSAKPNPLGGEAYVGVEYLVDDRLRVQLRGGFDGSTYTGVYGQYRVF